MVKEQDYELDIFILKNILAQLGEIIFSRSCL